jgi:superkiller protein 8
LVGRCRDYRYRLEIHASIRRGSIGANTKSTASVKDVHPWAIALSGDGQYLAGVSESGRVGVWDLNAGGAQIRDHETKGSFGTCIDLVGPPWHC